MTDYTPTTDEVDTGFTTYAWELEMTQPGSYGENSGYESYREVCASFRRWLAQVKAEAQVEALREAADSGQFAGPIADLLASRADRIAREAGIETGEKQ